MPHGRFLQKILTHKAQEVDQRRRRMPVQELEKRMAAQPVPRALSAALSSRGQMRVIAEIKRASPSAGVLRLDFDPGEIAASYHKAGADAISILTDEEFFQGALEHLERIRRQVPLPLLRKDFIIDAYQVAEARAAGADAVLLIVAALSPDSLRSLLAAASALKLEALVEVHDEAELETALAADAHIIGINNRNLQSFAIDLATTERLAPLVPKGHVIVAESGIRSLDDLRRVRDAGVDAILVGTHFMRHHDPGLALKSLKRALET